MYYDALIAKWATAPAGTTDQKLDWINAETVTGPPIPMIVPTHQIYNSIDRAEFTNLAPELQASVRDIISMGTIDASPGTAMRDHLTVLFPQGSVSFAHLAALAADYDTPQMPWWQAAVEIGGGGLVAEVKLSDLEQSGLA